MTFVIAIYPHPDLPVAATQRQFCVQRRNAGVGSRRDVVTTNRTVVGNISLSLDGRVTGRGRARTTWVGSGHTPSPTAESSHHPARTVLTITN